MTKEEKQLNQFYTKLGVQNQKVDWYYSEGKFHKCIHILDKVLEETEKKKLKVHQGLTSLKLADLYVQVYDYDKAIHFYKKGLKCLDQSGGPMTKTVSQIYKGLYQCYLHLGSHDDIIKYGMMACEYNGLNSLERAELNQHIALSHLKLYEEEAVMVYLIRGLNYAKEAIKHYKLAEKTESRDYIYSLYVCGDLFYQLREYQEAIEHLEEAYNQSGVAEVERPVLSKICYLLYKVYSIKGDENKTLYYKNQCLQF